MKSTGNLTQESLVLPYGRWLHCLSLSQDEILVCIGPRYPVQQIVMQKIQENSGNDPYTLKIVAMTLYAEMVGMPLHAENGGNDPLRWK